MGDNMKKETRKQYFHYFRVWFIVVGILLAATVAAGVVHSRKSYPPRTNDSAPEERVYDYADILTDKEEEKLREYIAKKEARYGADFVIMTINQPIEGSEALREGLQFQCYTTDWETNIMDIAETFFLEKGYGYNKDFEGDGSILLDNRYPGQRGERLSTSGRVEHALSESEVESVLYAVDDYYDKDPCKAYMRYIDKVCDYLDGGIKVGGMYYLGAFAVSVIIAAVYASSHLGKNKAKDTVAVNAYVAGGKPMMRNQGDNFIRKNVVTRRIETDSGSGGRSGRSSGGGGHHISRGGASFGGGSHRH